MVHLSTYLAKFYMKFGPEHLKKRPPIPHQNEEIFGTFISPVLMRHTVPQPPNVDLGKIWLHSSKPEKIQQHLPLHCNSFEGFYIFILDTFQLATNEDSKGFVSINEILNPRSTSVQSSPCHSWEKIPPKMSWQTTLRWRKLRQKGGIGMMYLVDVPKMPLIYRISSIWNWLDRSFVARKVENPEKSCI